MNPEKLLIDSGRILLVFVCLAMAIGTPLSAKVVVPRIFGSDMVLQRDMALPVRGCADAEENIQVSIGGQNIETVAADDGRWTVKLTPLHDRGPYTMTIEGKNRIKFTNVLVGEVWLCSGQSNMEFPV